MLYSLHSLCMSQNMIFVGQFLLLPFHHPSTTPILLLKTQKWVSDPRSGQSSVIVSASKRNPTAFAQLMSLLSDFYSRRSLQAHHLSLMTTPMPTSELASKKALMS